MDDVVRNAISAAVAVSLEPHADKFIKEIVHSALEEKTSYGRSTVLQDLTNSVIAAETRKVLQETIEARRPQIREAIEERLNAGAFTEKVIEAVEQAVSQTFVVNITIGKESF